MTTPRPDLAPLVNWKQSATLPIHRWLRYREGFSPQLIEALGLGARILDPFCGSGSLLVGAAEQERIATGIELNPLAAFTTRVKLRPLSESELGSVLAFQQQLEAFATRTERWPLPALRIYDKVFEPEILDTILRLRQAAEAHDDREAVRGFLLLAWLAILEPVGSYFKEGNGIKYRKRKRLKGGYTLREDGEWQLARFGASQCAFVVQSLRQQLADMLCDSARWSSGTW
ncbi:MAG TPA: hypothetical protein VMV09_08025, partial [Candidatus Saccharimonadales bacterium]|nr:hypothetical protein [Candidatus Saccharimonadales bacterium]